MGLSVQKSWGFLLLWTVLQNGSKDLPNFCRIAQDISSHCLSKIIFLKKILNLRLQGIKCPKGCLYLLLCTLLLNESKNFPMFLHVCGGHQGPLFEQDCFLKKFLIQDNRGLSVQKVGFFYYIALYCSKALRIFPIFCMNLENNHCCTNTILISRLQGITYPKKVYFLLLQT